MPAAESASGQSSVPSVQGLSVVVFSGAYDRVHYALAMAAAAVSINRPATLFFTMGGARALLAPDTAGPGWYHLYPTEDGRTPREADFALTERGLGAFDELLGACVALGADVMVCEMGLRALGLELADLRSDVPVKPGGLVTFLTEAPRGTAVVFV